MNLILFGHKRCGKSYFAKRLAEKLGRPCIDTDQLIEAEYFLKQGRCLACREIALQEGESAFRTFESQTLQTLKRTHNSIISVGGGMVLQPHNLTTLQTVGLLVFLILGKDLLKHRILKPPLPSYLDPAHPESSFETMYREREKKYQNIQAPRLILSGKTDAMILGELCNILKEAEKNHGQ